MQLSFFDEPAPAALPRPPAVALPPIRSPVGRCPACGTTFLAVEWVPWRKAGYCTESHQPKPH